MLAQPSVLYVPNTRTDSYKYQPRTNPNITYNFPHFYKLAFHMLMASAPLIVSIKISPRKIFFRGALAIDKMDYFATFIIFYL